MIHANKVHRIFNNKLWHQDIRGTTWCLHKIEETVTYQSQEKKWYISNINYHGTELMNHDMKGDGVKKKQAIMTLEKNEPTATWTLLKRVKIVQWWYLAMDFHKGHHIQSPF